MLSLFSRLLFKMRLKRRGALKLLFAWLAAMFAGHVLAMQYLEGMNLGDAVWLTAITMTTVGYGDVSAKLASGRIATLVLVVGGMIFVLPILVNLLIERATERQRRRQDGTWKWNLRMHLLIISTTGTETTKYLSALVHQVRQDVHWSNVPIQVLTTGFDRTGLPDELRSQDVVFYSGDGDTPEELAAVNANDATLITVLGDSRSPKADAYVFDVVERIRAGGYQGRIVAECFDDRNRARLRRHDDDVALRPVRGYPEILARAIIAPGSEQLIEDIFTAGGPECAEVKLNGARAAKWADVVSMLVARDLGTAIGAKYGPSVQTTPQGSQTVTFDTLYVILPPSGGHNIKTQIRGLLENGQFLGIDPR